MRKKEGAPCVAGREETKILNRPLAESCIFFGNRVSNLSI